MLKLHGPLVTSFLRGPSTPVFTFVICLNEFPGPHLYRWVSKHLGCCICSHAELYSVQTLVSYWHIIFVFCRSLHLYPWLALLLFQPPDITKNLFKLARFFLLASKLMNAIVWKKQFTHYSEVETCLDVFFVNAQLSSILTKSHKPSSSKSGTHGSNTVLSFPCRA